jgi:hypothetical protein
MRVSDETETAALWTDVKSIAFLPTLAPEAESG